MEAHLLSIDKFSKPLVHDKSNANYIHLMYLLLLEKGKFQSHPNMGVGIKERYKFKTDTDELLSLREDIRSQIEKYLPNLQFVNVGLNFRDNILGIIIEASDGLYTLSYDIQKEIMDVGSKDVLKI